MGTWLGTQGISHKYENGSLESWNPSMLAGCGVPPVTPVFEDGGRQGELATTLAILMNSGFLREILLQWLRQREMKEDSQGWPWASTCAGAHRHKPICL